MLTSTMRAVAIPGHLTRLARDVAVFVAVSLVLVDLLTISIDYFAGSLHLGRGPATDLSDVTKATGIAVGLAVVAFKARSRGSAVFATVFALIGIQDQLAWHGQAARILADSVNLAPVANLLTVSPIAIGEFYILSILAVIGLALVWLIPDNWPGFRRVRRLLTAWFLALVFTATFVDLLTARYANAPGIAFAEEAMERLALTGIASYVAGLVTIAMAGYASRR